MSDLARHLSRVRAGRKPTNLERQTRLLSQASELLEESNRSLARATKLNEARRAQAAEIAFATSTVQSVGALILWALADL